MYDNDEEIRRKRRKLLITIGIVVGIILLLLLIIIIKSKKRTNTPPVDPNLKITCELEVIGGVQPNSQNIYTQEIEVGFKNIVGIKGYTIEKKKIGTTDNSRNSETYKISKSGTYQLHGYIQDNAGNKNTCDLTVTVELTKPSCELEVTEGTLGENGWYKSDVLVGFKLMSSNSETATIVKYYIEPLKEDLDTHEAIRADEPTGNLEAYKVTNNLETALVGYVIDSNGQEGKCTITVKKDSTVPTCSLKVVSGSPDSTGIYQTAPVVGLNEVKDDVSEITGKGVGVKANYTEETYTVEGNGKITVYGYVKDAAGNAGTCSLVIQRPEKKPDPTPQPKDSTPSCTLKSEKVSNGVLVRMYPNTTGGAKITAYGVSTTKGNTSNATLTLTKAGTYTVYGTVKDSYGHTGYCQLSVTVSGSTPTPTETKLASKVKVGDYVSYDAGKWNEAPSSLTNNGDFGGFTKGSSRNVGVKCHRNDTGTRDGWMVLKVANGKVTLVHAGTPECVRFYDSTGRNSAATVVSKINARAAGYKNATYAESAHILKCGEGSISCKEANINTVISTNQTLYQTGTYYYLATNDGDSLIWYITNSAKLKAGSLNTYGIRPVVVLKASVLYTGGSGTQKDPYRIGV